MLPYTTVFLRVPKQRGIPGWDKLRQGEGTELRVGDVREGSSGGYIEVVCRECPPLVEDVARNDMLQAELKARHMAWCHVCIM